MIDKLCPFCGSLPRNPKRYGKIGCSNEQCAASKLAMTLEQWNNRTLISAVIILEDGAEPEVGDLLQKSDPELWPFTHALSVMNYEQSMKCIKEGSWQPYKIIRRNNRAVVYWSEL